MKTKLLLASILLLTTITVTIFSCKRDSFGIKETTKEESLNSLSHISLGCYDNQTEEGTLKYSTSVTNHFLEILIGNNTQITNSHLLKEFDSSTSQYNFFIIANFNDGIESGGLGIGLDVLDDDIIFNVAVPKCTHFCKSTGACNCAVRQIRDCVSHFCNKTCTFGEEGNCEKSYSQTITTNAQNAQVYLNQNIPEC